MMIKVIHAGSASAGSFDEASKNLSALAEVDVSAKRIGRLVTRVGNERIHEVHEQSRAFEAVALPARTKSPVAVTPDLVCVQVDGGRMQIRDRKSSHDAATDDACTFWRESKVGALIKMHGEVYQHDPCLEIPSLFVDAERISRLAREIKSFSGDQGDRSQFDCDVETTDSEAVVLEGRCYEQESVPFKALGSLIDSLAFYLATLPEDVVQGLCRGIATR